MASIDPTKFTWVTSADGKRSKKATRDAEWRARWRTPAGESRSQTFARKIDAERHLTSMEHSKLSGAYIDPKAGRTTVEDFYNVWAERQPWRASSRMTVTSLFTCHVLPNLGRRPLNTLTRGDVESWAAKLPLAGQTARTVAQYLSTMLESAVDDGLLAQNPARRAKRPRVDTEPVVPFTADEVDALRAAAPPSFRVALTLGLGAGLRQSEATGLTVDRVDFLRKQLTVDRQLVSPKAGEPTLGPPKTQRSYRTVPLADVVVEELAAHVAEFGTGLHGLLICTADGRPMRRQRFGTIWRTLRAEANLPEARFHGTRHTFASMLLSGGVSVAATADYLGHSPQMLLSTYAHLVPADHDRARSVVQAAFDRDAVCHTRVTEDLG